MGVLKGTSITSVIAISGLVIALVTFGIRVLITGSHPGWLRISIWSFAIVLLTIILAYVGQLG
jgi:hypothetical protein